MKNKALVLVGLILIGWAAWNHITSSFNTKEMHSSIFLLCCYAVYIGVINAKFNRTVRVIAPMITAWCAGVCVIYTTLPSCDHRWLQELAETFHVNQEVASKGVYLACITILIVVVNILVSNIIGLLKKQKPSVGEFVFTQVMVVFILAYNITAVVFVEKNSKQETTLTKVTEEVVWVLKSVSAEKENFVEPEKEKPAKKLSKIESSFDVRLKGKSAEEISADDLNQLLGGVLKGKGSVFIKAGKKHRINPLFLAGVAIHESDNGKSRAAKQFNNPLGIMGGKEFKDHRKFDSVDDAIEYTAKLFASSGRYVRSGKCTVQQIQRVYCPVIATNDPKKLNKYWLSGVLSWMNKIHKEALVASN